MGASSEFRVQRRFVGCRDFETKAWKLSRSRPGKEVWEGRTVRGWARGCLAGYQGHLGVWLRPGGVLISFTNMADTGVAHLREKK